MIIEPKIVHKGWGYERWIANGDYCGKELFFFAGKRCSFHYHNVKDETFFLVSGKVEIRHDENGTVLRPGQCFHVPPGMRHQIIAIEDSRLIEVSTHHEDSDSIRLIEGDVL